MTLLERARAERADYLRTLSELVTFESPSADKAANDRLLAHLAALLEADGWQLERRAQREVGDQLIARQAAPGGVSSLLLAHIDTVWPLGTSKTMPLREADDKLYGPGVLDMKAGVATAIHALRLLRRQGAALRGPVTLLLTSDEETGSLASRELIEALARAHDRVLVLEPGREDGALKTGRKGVGGFEARFSGVSAHAGNDPEAGASALRELAHFLLYAESLGDEEALTTVNVTVAQGGSVSNVIAEEARCVIDLRVMRQGEGERVAQALSGYRTREPRVALELSGGLNRPPLEPTAANAAVFEEAKVRAAELGLSVAGAVVGGGSDGNFTSALGVPTLDGLGGVGAGPHARHEHIRIPETLERLALVAALLGEA